MELGGLDHDRDRVFLLSTTHGAETHALAAALAVMNTYRDEPVIETLHRQGNRLKAGIEALHAAPRTNPLFQARRPDCRIWSMLVVIVTECHHRPSAHCSSRRQSAAACWRPHWSQAIRTRDDDIDRTIEAIDGALAVYQRALEDGPQTHLIGRPVAPVFRRRATSTSAADAEQRKFAVEGDAKAGKVDQGLARRVSYCDGLPTLITFGIREQPAASYKEQSRRAAHNTKSV